MLFFWLKQRTLRFFYTDVQEQIQPLKTNQEFSQLNSIALHISDMCVGLFMMFFFYKVNSQNLRCCVFIQQTVDCLVYVKCGIRHWRDKNEEDFILAFRHHRVVLEIGLKKLYNSGISVIVMCSVSTMETPKKSMIICGRIQGMLPRHDT